MKKNKIKHLWKDFPKEAAKRPSLLKKAGVTDFGKVDQKLTEDMTSHPMCAPNPENDVAQIPILRKDIDSISYGLSDLLCWWEGVKFGASPRKRREMAMGDSGIRHVRDLAAKIKAAIKK